MNRTLKIRKSIDHLKTLSKEKGFLLQEDVVNEMKLLHLSEKEFEGVWKELDAFFDKNDDLDDVLDVLEKSTELLSEETVLLSDPNTIDPIRQYLNEISVDELLTADEEKALAIRIEKAQKAKEDIADQKERLKSEKKNRKRLIERIQKNEMLIQDGKEAADELVSRNLRLVVSIAKHYPGYKMEFDDIVQEGNTGLIRATESYNYRKGFRFSTYATWWIKQAITRAIATQERTIRLPVHIVELINKVRRCQRELTLKNNREPTTEELAAALNMEKDKVENILRVSMDTASLDMPLGEEGDTTLGDFVEDTSMDNPVDVAMVRSLREKINEVLDALTDRERQIIIHRFGLNGEPPKTLEECGILYDLTRERIRQIEAKALRKLRHPKYSKRLEEYSS